MGNKYTSPFFGDRDLGGYTPPSIKTTEWFPIRNREEAVKYNELGQIYEADVFVNTTQHHYVSSQSLQAQDTCVQYTVEGQADKPVAILAIPSTYGNSQYTEPNQINRVWTGLVKTYHDMETFQYFIVSKNNGASITARFDNNFTYNGHTAYRQSAYAVKVIKTDENSQTETPPIISEIGTTVYSNVADSVQRISSVPTKFVDNSWGIIKRLETMNSNTPQGVKWYSYDQSVGLVDNSVILKLAQRIGEWKEIEDTVIDDIYFTSVMGYNSGQGTQVPNTGSPVAMRYIGTFIATGFPVFTLESFDQMVRYFQGESWDSDNADVSPADWSTDWDIYIKGAQKPDIFITMKSENMEEWLDNPDENKSGIEMEDVKVEYRYRLYKDKTNNNNPYEPPNYSDTDYTVTDWIKDDYDVSRETSYLENIDLNYPLLVARLMMGEFSDAEVEGLMNYYAQMEFRLHYGKYKSTWCRYKIGVIGSPSIPDFAKMQNEGVQDDEWQDYSTVTLHYDEYPPDYDPFPTPPVPPSPPPKPTQPTPSINGTGLLTTTYKITESQAKALGRFFWGKELFQKIKALNLSPIENVVALTYMPINIAGDTSVIVIGDVDTNINGDKISGTTPLYTLGSVMVEGRYHSFLDFAPYTSAHIFLPFVGFVPIDPQVFTGKTLTVRYSYDLIAGVCNAMLFANDIYVESHQGNCGIDVPLVASNRAEVMLGIVTSLASTALSPVNPKGNMALDILNMGSDIANAASSFHSNRQGSYSPACAWTETRECYLVLETPNAWMDKTYAHDYGRPYLSSANIGQLSGFTVCDQTVDVSGIGGATEEEKRKIREILTSGFYA